MGTDWLATLAGTLRHLHRVRRQPAWGPDRDLWVLSQVQGRVLTVTLHDGAQRDLPNDAVHLRGRQLPPQREENRFFFFAADLSERRDFNGR